ncbi:MAG: 3-dehydroquinate synthase [Alphaproteobacteria bacterium]|nr:3-dehydroquinate synthase [Alphaproteobacteria bacterium]
MNTPEILTVPLGDRRYDIVIGRGLLREAGERIRNATAATRAVIITDERVAPLHLAPLELSLEEAFIAYDTLVLPAGEASKDFATLEKLLTQLLDMTPDRNLVLIALGGGVMGDLTGFAASILLRGVRFVQIPTTLLAQVDSSVGGKTGINTRHGKNLVGSFHQPSLVLADTATLSTLPRRELLAGYAEVVKYGVIGDTEFFEWLERHGQEVVEKLPEALARAVLRSCRAKAEIVASDERESTGRRALLNFGHTFGHALEAETGYGNTLLHGEAVAIGMVLAMRLSEEMGFAPEGEAAAVEEHLAKVGLPTSPAPLNLSAKALLAHMYGDKKAESGALTFVMARGIGDAFVEKNVPADAVLKILQDAVKKG